MRIATITIAFLATTFSAGFFAQDAPALPDWIDGPDWVHRAVQIHESEPLGEKAELIRPLLIAHFKQVDYLVCGDVIGPLFGSKKDIHEIIAWQIVFGSGDWVEQNPEQANEIDAYTLAGLESGLRSYSLVLEQKPKIRSKRLDELLALYRDGQLQDWVNEHPCRPE